MSMCKCNKWRWGDAWQIIKNKIVGVQREELKRAGRNGKPE